MPIKVPKSTFKPAPEGLHQVVCVDVVAGRVTGQYGTRDVVKISWQTESINPANNKPYLISQQYGLTFHPKGFLRPMLRSWRGRDFSSPQEMEDFDLEVLIGVNAQINVIHESRDGVTYGNIAAIMPLPKGVSKIAPRDYIRVVDRKPQQPEDEPGLERGPDDDIPF